MRACIGGGFEEGKVYDGCSGKGGAPMRHMMIELISYPESRCAGGELDRAYASLLTIHHPVIPLVAPSARHIVRAGTVIANVCRQVPTSILYQCHNLSIPKPRSSTMIPSL